MPQVGDLLFVEPVVLHAAMVTGDARTDTDLQRGLFCGAGAAGAARPEDYAAFMRYAMWLSLSGARATRSLGFRSAQAAD
ncbi:MAG: sulfatase modifying factor 1 [Planctomycetota bacterium]